MCLFTLTAHSQSVENLLNAPLLNQLLNSQGNEENFNLGGQEFEVNEDIIHELTQENIRLIREQYIQTLKISSELENEYSYRSKKSLSLVGYDLFEKMYSSKLESSEIRVGSIQDQYLIGPGDEIILQLKGGKNNRIIKKVLNNGTLLFSFSDPLMVAGLTFGEVKGLIENAVSQAFIETDAYITLGELKQIKVTVSGEVNIPGQYKVSSLASVLDIILLSGGIKKEGTLRNIKVFSNGSIRNLDLYNIVFGLNPEKLKSINLTNGSLILVPPLGKTAAIVGNINSPGIYEILEKNQNIEEIFKISGSLENNKEFFVKRLTKTNNDKVELNFNLATSLNNKDLIFVMPKEISSGGLVNLQGAVKSPFLYPVEKYSTLSSIVPNANFLIDDAYKFAFILKTKNNKTLSNEYKVINLWNIFKHKKDLSLKSDDELYFLRKTDLDFLLTPNVINVLNPITSQSNFNCSAVKILSEYVKAANTSGKFQFFLCQRH